MKNKVKFECKILTLREEHCAALLGSSQILNNRLLYCIKNLYFSFVIEKKR